MLKVKSKRQKRFTILFYIISFIYLILSNYIIFKLPGLLFELNSLFFIAYLICFFVVILHSMIFGNWLVKFEQNFLTIKYKEQPNEVKFIKNKSKLFIKFRNWIND